MLEPNLNPKKCILLLGASTDQLFIIKTAHEMGLETAVIDGNPNAPGLEIANYSAPIDFSNIPAVIAFVNDLKNKGVNMSGVTTMGSDVPHFVSKIANQYGWSGPSEETGRLATNKYEMKCRFKDCDIPVPNFCLVNSAEKILELWQKWNCLKIIVKPTDRAGARGVRVVFNKSEINDAFDHAKANSRNGQVLIEEYIEGPQFSTETIISADQAKTPGFVDRVYENMEGFLPNIIENGGRFPSNYPDKISELKNLAEKAARAIGINNGVGKGDLVYCPKRGPLVIEVAARLGGGDFCESLVPLGTGVNYVKQVINIAIGEKVNFDELEPIINMHVANRNFFPPPGKLTGIKGIDEVDKLNEVKKFQISYKHGDEIPLIQNHAQKAGVFVVVSNTAEEIKKLVEYIYHVVQFEINGKYYSGNPIYYNQYKNL